MKKRLLGAISSILLIAACGRDVPEEPDTAGRQREEETGDVEAAATPEPEKEAETAAELKIRLVTNNIQSEDTVEHDGEEAFPIGYISSVSVEVDETSADDYKALAEALENYNTEKADSSLHTLSRIVADAKENPAFLDVMYSSNTDEETAFVKRADDKILSVGRSTYSYYNGAHPVTWYSSVCFDTKTGEQIPLSDIVSDIRALPQQISDNLEYVVDDYTPEAEELEEMHSKIEEIVADGELV